MFCGNCGKKIDDNSATCPFCGDTLTESFVQTEKNECKKFFIDPNEQYIDSLGNGYFSSFLTTRNIKRCVAVLSDKRVYLRGNMIDYNSGKLERSNTEKVINVADITGTGFVYASTQVWKLILAILTIPLIIPAILFLVSYLKGRNTLFVIEYAGGCIKFDASLYNLTDVHNFHKQIRLVQDSVKGNSK